MRAVVIRFYHFSHLTAVSKILVILHSTVLLVLFETQKYLIDPIDAA